MELYYVMSIVDRKKAKAMVDIYREHELSAILEHLGKGTATSEHLLLYDLQQEEKTIVSSIVGRKTLKHLIVAAKEKMYIDIPGNGIMMAIPIKSVSGGKTLAYFTNGQEVKGGGPEMNFEHELIVVILNEGYADTVMDAARKAGASGGTVLHAKGTGREQAKKFYGVRLAEEKDMIYILASADQKAEIMQAINRECGIETPSGALSFSLPVSEVVGIRNVIKEDEE